MFRDHTAEWSRIVAGLHITSLIFTRSTILRHEAGLTVENEEGVAAINAVLSMKRLHSLKIDSTSDETADTKSRSEENCFVPFRDFDKLMRYRACNVHTTAIISATRKAYMHFQ